MKLKETHLLWAAWLMLTIGVVAENINLRKEIENNKEHQEQVHQMLYESIHKLAHQNDSLWIYTDIKKEDY